MNALKHILLTVIVLSAVAVTVSVGVAAVDSTDSSQTTPPASVDDHPTDSAIEAQPDDPIQATWEQTYWEGQVLEIDLASTGVGPEDTVEIREVTSYDEQRPETDRLVREVTVSELGMIVVDTARLNGAGDYVMRTPENNYFDGGDFAFDIEHAAVMEVVEPDLDTEFANDTVALDEEVDLEFESNRETFDVELALEHDERPLGEEESREVVPDADDVISPEEDQWLVVVDDAEQSDSISLNVSHLDEPGNFTVTASIRGSTATDTASVTVRNRTAEATPTPTPAPSPTPTPEPTPTPTPEPTPTPDSTPTPTPEPTPTSTPTPDSTPTSTPTETPEPTPTETPEPSDGDSASADEQSDEDGAGFGLLLPVAALLLASVGYRLSRRSSTPDR